MQDRLQKRGIFLAATFGDPHARQIERNHLTIDKLCKGRTDDPIKNVEVRFLDLLKNGSERLRVSIAAARSVVQYASDEQQPHWNEIIARAEEYALSLDKVAGVEPRTVELSSQEIIKYFHRGERDNYESNPFVKALVNTRSNAHHAALDGDLNIQSQASTAMRRVQRYNVGQAVLTIADSEKGTTKYVLEVYRKITEGRSTVENLLESMAEVKDWLLKREDPLLRNYQKRNAR